MCYYISTVTSNKYLIIIIIKKNTKGFSIKELKNFLIKKLNKSVTKETNKVS